VGHADAKPVEDAAARRDQEPQIDAVLVGQHPIAVFFDDLQLVEPPAESGDQRDLAAGEQCRPAAEQLLALGLARHGGSRLARTAQPGPITERWARPSRKLASGNIAIVKTPRMIVLRKSRRLRSSRQCTAHNPSSTATVNSVNPAQIKGK